jgi:Flp pilus assembly protein TadD
MGLYQARRYKEAIEMVKVALELDAMNAAAHSWLGFMYLAAGNQNQAVAEAEAADHFSKEQHQRESAFLSRLGYVYGITGRRKQAEAVLADLHAMSTRIHTPATDYAVVYIGLGEQDLAFTWLNKAYDEHAIELSLINADPRFDSLRSDARFQNLIRRMKFPG